MARIRDPARDKAFELWKEAGGERAPKGILKEIAETLEKSETLIRKWKNIDEWSSDKNTSNNVSKSNISKSNVTKSNGNVTNEKNKINWLKLENEYVTDITQKVTLKALSEKYNISFQVIQNYSADNDWTEKRKNYIRNTLEKTQEKLADKTSDVMAEIMENINSALLKASKELHIHEEVNGFGQLVTIPTKTVRTNKVVRLMKAVDIINKDKSNSQKLELEKEKFLIMAELKRLEILTTNNGSDEKGEENEDINIKLKNWENELWKKD